MDNILPYAGMMLRDHTNLPKEVILCILQYTKSIVLPKRNVHYSFSQFNNKKGRYWNKLILYDDFMGSFKKQTIEEYPRRTYITIEAPRRKRYKYNYETKHVKVYTHYPSVNNKKRNKKIERWLMYRF